MLQGTVTMIYSSLYCACSTASKKHSELKWKLFQDENLSKRELESSWNKIK